MSGYLIYHPSREKSRLENFSVYHDALPGNQDPYVWNTQFLHTYCHMSQMSPSENDINFWVSGDTFPAFSSLYCDLVFVVKFKRYWEQPNFIDPQDPIVDSDEAYNDHYQWAQYNHPFKRRHRFTLKADPHHSFQPQDANKRLIDIVPFLIEMGLSLDTLRKGLQINFASRPIRLDNRIIASLYQWLYQEAEIKLTGEILEGIRQKNPQLASPQPLSGYNAMCVTGKVEVLEDSCVPISRRNRKGMKISRRGCA